MDDLDVLEPAAVEVAYRGERLQVRPLTIGAVPRLIRAARPITDALMEAPWLRGEGGEGAFVQGVMDLLEQHADDACRAVAVCMDRDVEWVQGGDFAEFFELASGVLEVNRDFFTRRIASRLGGLLAMARGAGPTPSSS